MSLVRATLVFLLTAAAGCSARNGSVGTPPPAVPPPPAGTGGGTAPPPPQPDLGVAGSGGQGGTGGGEAGSGGAGTGGAGTGGAGTGGAVAPGTGGSTPAPDAAEQPPAGKPMQIYWVDVEGGAATLIVAPGGETLLFDAGWDAGRGADRILPLVEKDVGARRLDYFLLSHYHADHAGGIGALARAAQIGAFVDHGNSVEGNNFGAGAFAGKRTSAKPGHKIQLGAVEVTVVAAARQVVEPLPPAKANPHCAGASSGGDRAGEDPESLGFVARFGSFDFVALGDLTAGVAHRLVCPQNRIGEVEVFQSSQHGDSANNPPTLVHGLAPVAIVVTNGAGKGGQAGALEVFKRSPGLVDLWQVHRSNSAGTANTADAFIANLAATDHWLRATVQPDGTFEIFNPRTGQSRRYQSR